MEYAAVNLLDDTDVLAYEFRSDPGDNVDVELLPALDALAATRMADLRAEHRHRIDQVRASLVQSS